MSNEQTTIVIGTDCEEYGTDATPEEGRQYAAILAKRVREAAADRGDRLDLNIGPNSSYSGPEADHYRDYIETNWMDIETNWMGWIDGGE